MARPRKPSKDSRVLPDRQILRDLTKTQGRITDYSKVTPTDLKMPKPSWPHLLRGKR